MSDAQSNYYNSQAASLAAQVANQAAQLEFQRMRFQQLELPQFQEMTAIEKEKLAFAKASEVWSEAFREASLSGMYQGKSTTEWLATQAQLTGSLYGQQTLQGQNQQFNQQLQLGQLTGMVNTPTPLTADEQVRYQDLQWRIAARAAVYGAGDPGEVAEMERLQAKMNGAGGTPTQTLAAQGQQAQYTGLYNGAPTLQSMLQQAQLTGQYNGQNTPEYQQMLAQMTGQFNGSPTEAASEFARQLALEQAKLDQAAAQFEKTFGLSEGELTGRYNGENTLGRDTMENQQANQLLGLAASLRGPRNAAQYAKVIGGTPGGLTDVLGAMAGRYNLPSYQGGTAAPEAVTLQNFVGDVQATARGLPAYNPTPGGTWAQPAPAYQVSPPGAQAPSNSWNYQSTGDGSQMVYPPGISAPVQAAQVSSQTPLSSANLNQIGAQQLAAQPYALPAPNTWNADSFNNLGDYRQQLMLGQYEAAGNDADSVLAQYKASLPNSGGPTSGAIKVAGL